jgi:hypothetical protein
VNCLGFFNNAHRLPRRARDSMVRSNDRADTDTTAIPNNPRNCRKKSGNRRKDRTGALIRVELQEDVGRVPLGYIPKGYRKLTTIELDSSHSVKCISSFSLSGNYLLLRPTLIRDFGYLTRSLREGFVTMATCTHRPIQVGEGPSPCGSTLL